MTIQDVLEKLREKGWSDQDIGEALGASRTAVYRWRTGEDTPTYQKAVIYWLERRLLPFKKRPRRKNLADL